MGHRVCSNCEEALCVNGEGCETAEFIEVDE